jgi:hypothetical protein
MKVVINACFGGFGLSNEAIRRIRDLKGITKDIDIWGIDRSDPALVQVIEELGKAVNGSYADLRVVEIPDDVEWHIHEYDGLEHVAENHRIWS